MSEFTYFNSHVIEHKNILWFYIFVHDLSSVKHSQTFHNGPSNSPDLFFLNDSLVLLSFPNEVGEQVSIRCILHDKEKVPAEVLTILKEAMITLNEVRRWQLLHELSLTHHLLLDFLTDVSADVHSF